MYSVKTRIRYAIAGSDYSAQEPRVMTQLSGDPNLKETFEKDRDPYATMIAPALHKDYWECMEHYEDGTPNPEGKSIRKKGKTLMLGKPIGFIR